MTPRSVASRSWSRRRWRGVVAMVFVAQLALIFWLGETSPIRPRPAAPAYTLRLAGSGSAELLALRNPTLFVLPHPPAVHGSEELRPPQPEPHSFAWDEPTNPSLLALDQPGAAFNRFVATSDSLPLLPLVKPEPRLTLPDLPPQPISAGQSTVRLEGALAGRRLITPLDLRSWTNRDILTNSVVQLVVDADGRPRSVALLSGSGFSDADQHALDQARTARFEPLGRNPFASVPGPTAQLSPGRMIFLWHTLPARPTNAPAISP